MTLFSIGFTQKSAEQFFGRLREARVTTLVDVRLKNVSQLAGFAKKDDLAFFLKELCGAKYVHQPLMAPDERMLKAYKSGEIGWQDYELRFLDLMEARGIETRFAREDLQGACLLCSEHLPHHCHRRLVADYLNARWAEPIEVRHLT